MHTNVHTRRVPEYGKSQKWLTYGKKVGLAGVAQLVEQLPCKQQVNGSSPFASFDVRRSPSVSYEIEGLFRGVRKLKL